MSTQSQTKSIPEQMAEYLKEAAELRYSAATPGDKADQAELVRALQDIRTRLDRIEYLMVRAVIRKGDAYRALKNVQEQSSNKWDEKLISAKDKKAANLVSAQEFVAPREKYASANIATLEERREVRIAEDTFSWTETSVDALQKMYRGLDSARQDLLTRIKTIPVVNGMEYTTS